MKTMIAALILLVPPPGKDVGLEPWASKSQPGDAPKRRVEEISDAKHVYTVAQGGTLDGSNCRSPVGVGMGSWAALEQTWESNRSVRLENTGDTDVVNPWLSNGRNTFRTLSEIASSAVTAGMSDREKAMAMWFQEIRHRYHFDGDNNDLGDPVKVFNIYGYNTCGNDSICVAGLWRKAGLKVAPARLVGHCVTQVYFDNRWHVFDGDMHSMYLLRDCKTVAGEQDLVRDHDLVRRAHTQGILKPDIRGDDEWESSIYVFEGDVRGERYCTDGTSMNMTLRPGEAITWRWGHPTPIKYHGQSKPRHPDTICNGLWEYQPDFTKEAWRKGAALAQAVRTDRGELTSEAGQSGTIVWVLKSPYVFVGGKVEAEGTGAKFSVSWDGKAWEEAGADLDRLFPPAGPARYEYRLRCELDPGARLQKLRIVNDVQMAPLALPGMTVGANEFVYTDQSPGGRKVRVTHDWVERSASRPPDAPASPAFPADGALTKGTEVVFRWAPAKDIDGAAIADYHFELSDRADMRWPLSPHFYKLISRTADQGKAQYTLPQAGLLASDTKYYWHVRAKDAKGVWGPWSKTWSFTPHAPAPPADVSLAFDAAAGKGILKWKPDSSGRKPAKYRVYGSDEKGFSVSDEPYKVTVGISKELPSTFPANFVADVAGTELTVIGRDLALPNANRAFYRVVALDEEGSRSGPSDYAAAPGGFISSKPLTKAKSGVEYRSALAAIRSLGDLRTRVVDGREVMNFWDVERLKFTLTSGPAWLTIDEKTGVLSGTPTAAGKAAVTVSATVEKDARVLDEKALVWGVEKVVSTAPEKVAGGILDFVVEIE
ncbi:MAG TPA: Ig domain-containing protein [Planctomycetota bacterium]|nr:Ig domain-containing protein [Planctomycetota bacterium]